MNDFEIIKCFLAERKNLSYTLNQIAMIVKLSSKNINKNYSKADVILCLQKNNIEISELLSYTDLLVRKNNENLIATKKKVPYEILHHRLEEKLIKNKEKKYEKLRLFILLSLGSSFVLYNISPALMTVVMSFILLYQINKEKLSNIKYSFEAASIFGLLYTLIFNFFSYDIFNPFDNHIAIHPFNPMIFTITTLLYYGIFTYKFTIISIIFPFFLYMSYKTSTVLSLITTIIVLMLIIRISLLFKLPFGKEYFKIAISRYFKDGFSFVLAIMIIPIFNNVYQQKDDLFHKLYKSKNIDHCLNINVDFEIIKRSNKNDFIVIDSKNFKFKEVFAYIILNNSQKIKKDFKFDNNMFSYNYLIDLIKDEKFLKEYKIENKNEFYKIKKILQEPTKLNRLKKEANLIDSKTLNIIEYYVNLENKERFFYYKCE